MGLGQSHDWDSEKKYLTNVHYVEKTGVMLFLQNEAGQTVGGKVVFSIDDVPINVKFLTQGGHHLIRQSEVAFKLTNPATKEDFLWSITDPRRGSKKLTSLHSPPPTKVNTSKSSTSGERSELLAALSTPKRTSSSTPSSSSRQSAFANIVEEAENTITESAARAQDIAALTSNTVDIGAETLTELNRQGDTLVRIIGTTDSTRHNLAVGNDLVDRAESLATDIGRTITRHKVKTHNRLEDADRNISKIEKQDAKAAAKAAKASGGAAVPAAGLRASGSTFTTEKIAAGEAAVDAAMAQVGSNLDKMMEQAATMNREIRIQDEMISQAAANIEDVNRGIGKAMNKMERRING